MSKIKYRYEYNGNPDYVTLHVTCRVTEEKGFVTDGLNNGSEKDMQLLSLMKGVAGVMDVSLRSFSISVQRGRAFDRDTVLDGMLDIFKMWMSVTTGLTSDQDHEYEQLPTLRSDIAGHICSACKREQDEMMRRTARLIDSLEF